MAPKCRRYGNFGAYFFVFIAFMGQNAKSPRRRIQREAEITGGGKTPGFFSPGI
jgi:hypothetical protein